MLKQPATDGNKQMRSAPIGKINTDAKNATSAKA